MRSFGFRLLALCLIGLLLAGCVGRPVAAIQPDVAPAPRQPQETPAATPYIEHTGAQENVESGAAGAIKIPPAATTPVQTPAAALQPTRAPEIIDTAAQGAALSFEDLAPTIAMAFDELVGDNGIYEDIQAYPAPDTFHVTIDIQHQVVLVHKKGAKGEYDVPVRYMICSTGAAKTPTPRGTFSSGKHKVRFGLFVNDGVFGQYWTQITRRIYFHSLLYSQRNASSYTKTSYNNLGRRASHGCVRLLVPDARWMYYHIAPGTQIEIRKGDREDKETAAIREQLVRPKLPQARRSLKKGAIPHTDNWSIETYLNAYENIVSAD